MRNLLSLKTILIIVFIPLIFISGIYIGMKLFRDNDVTSFKQFSCNFGTYAERYIDEATTSIDTIGILLGEAEYQQLNDNRNNAVIKGVVLKEHKNY